MSRITINGVSLDPVADGPALQQHSLLSADSAASNYILVQTKGPLSPDERNTLGRLGAKILEYVPTNTYICHYDPSDLQKVRALPFVGWANTYMQGFKIAPSLHAGSHQGKARLLDLLGPPSSPADGSPLVDIVLHRDVDPKNVTAKIAEAAGIAPEDLKPARGKFRLHVNADRLNAISAIDQVRQVEPVFPKRLWNNIARDILGAGQIQTNSSLLGEGQIVGVCDTGLDRGSTRNVHPAFEGRIKKLYALGRPNNSSDPDGHGTHVCGSVLGDGPSNAYGPIRGIAPKAQLVMQSVLDAKGNLGGLPDDLQQIFQPAYGDGARVHSNSWGDQNNGYTQEAHDVDQFVWDNRDMVVVIAAGNAGVDQDGDGVIDPGSVGSPGTAKNCITVGASENDRPSFVYVDGTIKIQTYGEGWSKDYPADPIRDDKLADNPNGLAAFSSRGPTADGRIKPDVVAPGTAVLSTRSQEKGVGNGWGPSTDPLYFFDGGTSMATPMVAGSAAVVREYLNKVRNIATPSAALVKALLINGADALAGQYTPSETGLVPNSNQGFGRVNLIASTGQLANGQIQLWDEAGKLDTGDQQVFDIAIAGSTKAVKVTLVWTDPPGEALQNDLDLTVTTASGTYLGNAASGSNVPDRLNNVEQVLLTSSLGNQITVTVRAYRITANAQPFALVVRQIG